VVLNLVPKLATLLILAGLPAFAQTSGAATLQGTVKDSSGAVIAGAKITATHIESGVKSETVANHEGFFGFPPMRIGSYKVRCEASGMKAWEGETLLETGKTVDINPVLTVGDVTQTMMVTADIPMVTTAEPTDATTLDQQRVKELPLNGRSLDALIADVTPGLEVSGGANDGARVGGLLTYASTYTQDGAFANNRETGGSMGLQGLESVGEVRVETSTGNAKSATPASIIVNTRSGTNRYIVSLYETTRNNCCGVAKHRQDVNPNGTPFQLPKLIRNEFGGSIGGPVMLPSFGVNGKKLYDGHNRTFFFVSREQVVLRQSQTYSFSVPTVAQRQGDFSGLETNTGLPITLYDPLTGDIQQMARGPVTIRTPFPNNVIPISRQSPLSKYIYNLTPLPTDNTEPNIATNLKYAFAGGNFLNQNNNPTTIRIDHRLSDKDNFYAKTNWNQAVYWYIAGSGANVPTTNNAANVTYLPMQSKAAALGETHVFTPTLFVETLLNKVWQTTNTQTGPPDLQRDWASVLGLPNPYGQIGFPNLNSVGFSNYGEGDNPASSRPVS
jgi:hypothetical protein